jgi:hypothetical protein
VPDETQDRPTTVAEQLAEQKRRGNPAKKAFGIVTGLVGIVLLFASVFLIAGVFQTVGKDNGGRAPWSEKGAPVVKPEPLGRQ